MTNAFIFTKIINIVFSTGGKILVSDENTNWVVDDNLYLET